METSTPSNQQPESTGSASEGRSMRSRSAANTPAEKGEQPQASRKLVGQFDQRSWGSLLEVSVSFGHFNLKMIRKPEFCWDILSDDAGASSDIFKNYQT